VVAFAVVQRTREMGIRMALGATSRQVVSLFGRDTLRVAGIGVGIGLLLTGAASRVLSSIVEGLEPADALTVAAVAAVLVAAALLAALIPARRATRVDAMVALRAE
jgi:putative ABC transport system permease protein